MTDYIIRIHKAWKSYDMERAWSNTYEIMSGTEDFVPIDAVAIAFVAAERVLHCDQVNFLQYSLSTWMPDSKPYDPTSFVTHGLGNMTGTRTFQDGQALDYNVCLVVKRQANSGRVGRLYYRGCLGENDVRQAGDGRFQIDPTVVSPLAITQLFEGQYRTLMTPFLGGQVNIGAATLALISRRNTIQQFIYRRVVTALTLGGVTINKHKHRYFDRAPAA